MQKKDLNYRGFTLIELLVVVSIVAFVFTLGIVNLIDSRTKAKNASAFASAKIVQSSAYLCLASGTVQRLGFVGGSGLSQYICADSVLGPQLGGWPALAPYSWDNTFTWCDPRISLATLAGGVSSCGGYANGTCGGTFFYPDFCFFNSSGTKRTVCTEEGCIKIGY